MITYTLFPSFSSVLIKLCDRGWVIQQKTQEEGSIYISIMLIYILCQNSGSKSAWNSIHLVSLAEPLTSNNILALSLKWIDSTTVWRIDYQNSKDWRSWFQILPRAFKRSAPPRADMNVFMYQNCICIETIIHENNVCRLMYFIILVCSLFALIAGFWDICCSC